MKTMKINVTGVVQGVGFRPNTVIIAGDCGVTGTVQNTGSGVEIIASGTDEKLRHFYNEVIERRPSQSHIAEIECQEIDYRHFDEFSIIASESRAGVVFVPVDLAICPDCAAELDNSADKRYEYPFINCTQCGPRYTIIEGLPYDRPLTTMSAFKMCESCQAEYDDVHDRRYHAQPNACEVCGPNVWMGKLKGVDAVKRAAELVDAGEILAMRGLGGYHLICDAQNDDVIARLRGLKRRQTKPLAVMCAKRELINAPDNILDAIFSPKAPIVIFKWENHPLSNLINPLGDDIGVMCTYTPLHKLLLKYTKTDYIVATSANLQDESITAEILEAEEKLAYFTPHFLHHNRPIKTRIDDSVAVYAASELRLLRRGRGYAPFPIKLPVSTRKTVFAAGAHLKNCLTVTKGKYAFVSQYLGDLDNAGTVDFYRQTYDQICALLNSTPELAVCDLHDGYFSTDFAKKLGIPLLRLQHHHAHMFAVMAEHNLKDNVIAVIMDGTGYGEDGAIWGGEFFSYIKDKVNREAHFQYVPQAGGDAPAKYPSRMAFSWLTMAGAWDSAYWGSRMNMAEDVIALNEAMIRNEFSAIPTSSAGRLFESIGAMVLGIERNEYEGHSAIALEACCSIDTGIYPYKFDGENVILTDTVAAVAVDIRGGAAVGDIAARFHNTIADIIVNKCIQISANYAIHNVVVSGGVFQNKRLLESVRAGLDGAGLSCFIPVNVPANDSGISLGQAYWAHLAGME